MMIYISKNDFITIFDGYLNLIKILHPFSPSSKRKVLDFMYNLNDFISKISQCDGILFFEKD